MDKEDLANNIRGNAVGWSEAKALDSTGGEEAVERICCAAPNA